MCGGSSLIDYQVKTEGTKHEVSLKNSKTSLYGYVEQSHRHYSGFEFILLQNIVEPTPPTSAQIVSELNMKEGIVWDFLVTNFYSN